MYLLGLTFFGLTHNYRNNLFTVLHEIVFHGQGGYDYITVYDMPIWLRKFTYNKMIEHYKQNSEENDQDSVLEKSIDAMKSANSVSKNVSSKITPNSYRTKSIKK